MLMMSLILIIYFLAYINDEYTLQCENNLQEFDLTMTLPDSQYGDRQLGDDRQMSDAEYQDKFKSIIDKDLIEEEV